MAGWPRKQLLNEIFILIKLKVQGYKILNIKTYTLKYLEQLKSRGNCGER